MVKGEGGGGRCTPTPRVGWRPAHSAVPRCTCPADVAAHFLAFGAGWCCARTVPSLPPPLTTPRPRTESLAEAVKTARGVEASLQAAREVYLPVATDAADLYFAAAQLCTVSPMYTYSLDSFLPIFQKVRFVKGVVPGLVAVAVAVAVVVLRCAANWRGGINGSFVLRSGLRCVARTRDAHLGVPPQLRPLAFLPLPLLPTPPPPPQAVRAVQAGTAASEAASAAAASDAGVEASGGGSGGAGTVGPTAPRPHGVPDLVAATRLALFTWVARGLFPHHRLPFLAQLTLGLLRRGGTSGLSAPGYSAAADACLLKEREVRDVGSGVGQRGWGL